MSTPTIQEGALCASPADPAAPFGDLPARALDRRELLALVEDLAARPELWRHHLSFEGAEDGGRHYVSLHRDSYVDVWLLCWRPGDDTGWHDHDVSSGAVKVVAGELKECNPRIGGAHLETRVTECDAFSFGPDHIHRLTGEAPGSVSIHAYSPPLWRMGQYSITDDGTMRRLSVGYADELRPLDPA